MNLYLISQDVNNGFDTYDSAVVCADSEQEAQAVSPAGSNKYRLGKPTLSEWATPENVTVKLIGVAAEGIEKGIICSSFNAG